MYPVRRGTVMPEYAGSAGPYTAVPHPPEMDVAFAPLRRAQQHRTSPPSTVRGLQPGAAVKQQVRARKSAGLLRRRRVPRFFSSIIFSALFGRRRPMRRISAASGCACARALPREALFEGHRSQRTAARFTSEYAVFLRAQQQKRTSYDVLSLGGDTRI